MKSSYVNCILLLICFVANLSTVFVDAKRQSGNLRRKIISGSSKGSSSESSKSPSSKGKGGKSSKSPSSKGRKSSKSPSSKGKGGKSSKSPSSKGKGGKSYKVPKSNRRGKGKGNGMGSSSRAPSPPGPFSPTASGAPTQPLFCAGYTESEYNRILSGATVSKIPGQPVNAQAADFVQQERFCPPGASLLTLETLLHERYALSAFYFASGGPTWSFCSQGRPCAQFENRMADSWLSNSHVCNWYGITCNGDRKVVDVAMVPSQGQDIGLNGIIANEVYELTELVTLKLEFNDVNPNKRGKLNGTLSDAMKNAKNLKLFDIDQQQIGGVIPDSFYDTTSLSNVDLDDNQFSGTLSGPGIAKLKDLIFFSASGNSFDPQPLPWQFGTLKSLKFLGLNNANLVGTVPPYFQQLIDMRALDLQDNSLVGSVGFLSNYRSLQTINLSNNDFTGAIPSSLWNAPELLFANFENTLLGAAGDDFSDLGISWNMPKLEVLRLANTDLSGPLPVEGLKKLPKLRVLTLENTNLVGTIPVESCSNWSISISKNGGILCPAKCSCIER